MNYIVSEEELESFMKHIHMVAIKYEAQSTSVVSDFLKDKEPIQEIASGEVNIQDAGRDDDPTWFVGDVNIEEVLDDYANNGKQIKIYIQEEK